MISKVWSTPENCFSQNSKINKKSAKMQNDNHVPVPLAPLPLRLHIHQDETTASYVSRIAALNGFENADAMCSAYKISYGLVIDGEPKALAVISQLTGVEVTRLQEFVLEMTQPPTWKGQQLVASYVEFVDLRFCPDCIADDIERRTDLPVHIAAYGRWQWLFNALYSCPHHNRALHSMPRAASSIQDFSCQLRDFLSYPHCEPSPSRKFFRHLLKSTSKES